MVAVWVPLETSWAYRGFFRAFRPKLGLVMEIEIWPRMIFASRRAGVPLFMCNAQYPTKSMARDAKLKLRHKLMQGYAGAFVKSDLQRDRFASVDVQNITVTGELRFDQPIPEVQLQAARTLRPLLQTRRVVALASVTQPEEALFLDVIARLFAVQDPPLVIVIPRAPERFGLMADALAARGLTAVTRTSLLDQGLGLKASGSAHALRAGTVFLGDSLGEMYFYLELSDRVVVGGGFQPKGSHNIIEPLALGKPVIVGPEIHTIEYPAVEAIAAGVCLQTTAEALARDIETWPDPTPRAISAYIDAHSGAGARTMAAIAPLL
jgi:3-deoxy-D-manno-octulosonic-acid transferase